MKIRRYVCMAIVVLVILTISVVALLCTGCNKDYEKKKKEIAATMTAPCRGLDSEALQKAQEFCQTFQIACGDKGTIIGGFSGLSFLKGKYAGGTSLDSTLALGNINISFDKGTASKKEVYSDIQFAFECRSKEIIEYANRWTSGSVSMSPKQSRQGAQVPDVIQGKEAIRALESIASKLPLPVDMQFDRLEENKGLVVWNGYWKRMKNGYPYEDDWVAISILQTTGEFVGYIKRYRMAEPKSTDVNIPKEKAIDLVWKMFKENNAYKTLANAMRPEDLYLVGADLIIMRTNKYDKSEELYLPPGREDSTLSWYVHFEFSGGVKLPIKKIIDSQYMTTDEVKAIDEYYKEVDGKWGPMGMPSRHVEARIDAATGRIIFFSVSKM